jgi:hypothetical protein
MVKEAEDRYLRRAEPPELRPDEEEEDPREEPEEERDGAL